MFVNSGMVQFKNVFTGQETRPYKRAASCQKCVRAGGKHNYLDAVGFDGRHHTFFEMLGNWSFGDYFKEGAVRYAWDFVTKELKLSKDRLWATVYKDDDETYNLWKKIAGLPESRIVRMGEKTNFWRMADAGPCGPCTEVFYDQGDRVPGGPPGSTDEDGDRYVEIWNLVLMQYDQKGPDRYDTLPNPCVDTGMGMERVAAILQGRTDNYDNDLMRGLMEEAARRCRAEVDDPKNRNSLKVIADHSRAIAFLIADGVLPSNEGRGYVLRRIMRRAMRHANMMGAAEPVLAKIAPEVAGQMGDAYPELKTALPAIVETVGNEEEKFMSLLDRGLKLLEAETKVLANGGKLPGDVAFKLYDTYGFPLDLTQDALRPRGIEVDEAGFNAAMAEQKTRARAAWTG